MAYDEDDKDEVLDIDNAVLGDDEEDEDEDDVPEGFHEVDPLTGGTVPEEDGGVI
jgi:hypothetical protein